MLLKFQIKGYKIKDIPHYITICLYNICKNYVYSFAFLLKGRYATDIRYFNLVFGSFNLLCKTACGPNYRS